MEDAERGRRDAGERRRNKTCAASLWELVVPAGLYCHLGLALLLVSARAKLQQIFTPNVMKPQQPGKVLDSHAAASPRPPDRGLFKG